MCTELSTQLTYGFVDRLEHASRTEIEWDALFKKNKISVEIYNDHITTNQGKLQKCITRIASLLRRVAIAHSRVYHAEQMVKAGRRKMALKALETKEKNKVDISPADQKKFDSDQVKLSVYTSDQVEDLADSLDC